MKAPLTSTGESYGSSVDTEDGVWGSERFSSCSSSGDSLKKAALRLVAHLRIYGQKGLHMRPIDRKMTVFNAPVEIHVHGLRNRRRICHTKQHLGRPWW